MAEEAGERADGPVDDAEWVEAGLGRPPRSGFAVVARDRAGRPAVIENPPLLLDGTPMPTTYWLIDPELTRRIGALEAARGVDRAERAVDPLELAAAHDAYAARRDALLTPGHQGHRPSGGVGGTRVGVKCLHAHYANLLAGHPDPVGEWVRDHLHEAP